MKNDKTLLTENQYYKNLRSHGINRDSASRISYELVSESVIKNDKNINYENLSDQQLLTKVVKLGLKDISNMNRNDLIATLKKYK